MKHGIQICSILVGPHLLKFQVLVTSILNMVDDDKSQEIASIYFFSPSFHDRNTENEYQRFSIDTNAWYPLWGHNSQSLDWKDGNKYLKCSIVNFQ